MRKLSDVSVHYIKSVLDYLKENTDCSEDEHLYIYKLNTFFPKLTLFEQHDLFEACKTGDEYIIKSFIDSHPDTIFDETGTSIPEATYDNNAIVSALNVMYNIAVEQPGKEGSGHVLKAVNFDIPVSKNNSLNSTIAKFILSDRIGSELYSINILGAKCSINPKYEFALNCILTYATKNKKKMTQFEYDLFMKQSIYRLDILIDGQNDDDQVMSIFKSAIDKLYSSR